ncbi:MAG: MarR family transcriptional regulator [Dysgonamonadaceae bacterium]|jgi:DNA-binding MarR family transcriptional regulator|nr:MarR family transcriptional regulator [Dysgonamonadaceae bacterium]
MENSNSLQNNKLKFCKIRDVYRSILEFEAKFQQQSGLNLNEGMLLCTLSEKERCTSGEIAEAMGLTCSNCSKVIANLEVKGLIKRTLGSDDKRKMYFSLTTEGKKTLNNLNLCNTDLPENLLKILQFS